ncbi:MAG: UDP-N-acetylmuramate dehydrogenase [Muribaculaceae bacterium]|nr:UDP-N-acetylmuramate dehydrogenase [Muribaculaceae bacterium]
MITTHLNYDLSLRNTFAMKVSCGCFMEYDSADDIPFLLSSIRKDIDIKHIGGGSNLLFTGDYPGVIVHSAIMGINEVGRDSSSVTLRVGSGVKMDDFILHACSAGLWGVENLSGIPGEAGASAVQNVGAYGREAADTIVAVHAYDCDEHEFVTLSNEECHFGYRDSIFKRPDKKGCYIIHAVDYRLSTIPAPDISYPALKAHFNSAPSTPIEVREAVIAIRDSKLPDPAVVPSAGSFFKNPVISPADFENVKAAAPDADVPHYTVEGGIKVPAAWLIDKCGWKGQTRGNVAVWHLQPLVIVNPDRRATPGEVIALEKEIISSVKQRFGVTLTPEVEHI